MKIKSSIFISVVLLFLLASCGKLEVLPNEPRIEYENFEIHDTVDLLGNRVNAGTMKFYFEDGDGDIGLLSQAQAGVEDYDSINLFVKLYRINNGAIQPAVAGDPFYPTGFRIPYMERTGRNKILRGHISVEFMYLFYSEEDSIKYEFYIKDRAGNISNTATTSVIPVSLTGVYEGE